jgi:hypothetical protein
MGEFINEGAWCSYFADYSVPELEKISKDKSKRGPRRFLSEGEVGCLTRLVARHREDVEAMARDRKP